MTCTYRKLTTDRRVYVMLTLRRRPAVTPDPAPTAEAIIMKSICEHLRALANIDGDAVTVEWTERTVTVLLHSLDGRAPCARHHGGTGECYYAVHTIFCRSRQQIEDVVCNSTTPVALLHKWNKGGRALRWCTATQRYVPAQEQYPPDIWVA